ncbi:MAG: hypothetical protein DLM59_06205 [Pseudonocardiales bacterium]|nr:MAG: hypothetical protein DLM59_06205 [Pseudonocardiales bacterium]
MRSGRRTTILGALFYGALLVLLAGCLVKVFPHILPKAIASRINHNSEGYVAALVLGSWIQFARARLRRSPLQWPLTLAAGAACLAIGVVMLTVHLPSQVKTLNEAFFALALLVPYVQLRRPLPALVPLGLSAAVLVLIVVSHGAKDTTLLAETLGMLLLAPITLDSIDRGILDSSARTSLPARYLWYAFLVVAPIVFSVVQYHIGDTGTLQVVTRYAVRVTEAFVFMLFVTLYFAVGLGRTGAGGSHDARRVPVGAAHRA